MKIYIIILVLVLPCLAVLNESENVLINVFGLAYSMVLCLFFKNGMSLKKTINYIKTKLK